MASSTKHFAKGSGSYSCGCCGRQTRSTGRGDNELLKLCAECYDIAGYANQVSDYGPESLTPSMRDDIQKMIDFIISKGGTPDWDYPELLPVQETPEALSFYLVTITGPNGFEVLLPVDAVKSSQARRMAKQEVKAEGQSLEGLIFNARKA